MKKKKTYFSKIINILFYLLLGAVLFKHTYSYLDPDLGWHLQTGKEIIETRSLPGPNHNNYTLLGQDWVDHEWLANAGLYWLYENLGYLSITITFTLTILLIVFLLNQQLKLWKTVSDGGLLIIMAVEFLTIVASAPHFGVRLQEISVLGLLLTLLIIKCFEKYQNGKSLLWLLPLFWLWSCLHGGFPIGIATIVAVAVGHLLSRAFSKNQKLKTVFCCFDMSKILPYKAAWLLLASAAVATVATLTTPYGLKLYSFLASYKNSFYLHHIQEWLPQWDFPYSYSQVIYISLLILSLAFSLAYADKKHDYRRLSLPEFALIGVFLILAIKSRRHVPLLLVVAWPFMMDFIISFLNISRDQDNKKSQYALPFLFIKFSIIFSLISIIIIQACQTEIYKDPFLYSEKYGYPIKAVEFLKSHPEYFNDHLLNEFSWGGFMVWTYPERLLFIDGRLPQYPYNGRSLLEEYWDFSLDDRIESKLKEHNISLVLMRKPTLEPIKLSWLEKNFLLINENEINKNEKKKPLLDYLDKQKNWKIIFADENAIIYYKEAIKP